MTEKLLIGMLSHLKDSHECVNSFKEANKKLYMSGMSCIVSKPTLCICENKDANQLHGSREAGQRLCFRYADDTILLLSKSKISSLLPSFCASIARFVSDLFRNHIVVLLMMQLLFRGATNILF